MTVAPRQPFTAWARQLPSDQPLQPVAFEPSLYLFPTTVSREVAIGLLAQSYEEIFRAELETGSTDPATWPSPRSMDLFQEWFVFHFFDLVSDQDQALRAHLEVDPSVLDVLHGAIKDSSLS